MQRASFAIMRCSIAQTLEVVGEHLLEHQDCGHLSHAVMTCDSRGQTLDAGSVKAVPGPGART